MKRISAIAILVSLAAGLVPAADNPPATVVAAVPPPAAKVLFDGTPVRLRLAENLSSADATTGQSVNFEVLDDIKAADQVVIKRGSPAIGTVTEAQPKRRMGRGGKLDITIDYVRMVNDEKVLLRATKGGNGGGHTGAMVGAMVGTAILLWPAAPLFLLMHGKDIKIPKGTEVTAFVNGDTPIGK